MVPTWLLITCGVCVVLSILYLLYPFIALYNLDLSKQVKDFEDRMTKEVVGKDKATARNAILEEYKRNIGIPSEGNPDIRFGEGLTCPLENGNGPDVFLIHAKNDKATGVTRCI
jgi:hypothetical protein